MKKTWVFAVVLLLLITGSSWGVQTTDFLNEHVVCLDSIPGTQGECDSAHVYVLFGNADYPCYMARTTDCGGSWIDSIDYAGRLHASYRFFDQVADCDCDSGAGKYEVIVTLFGSGVPTENSFSFELIDGNFNDLLMTMEPQTNRKNVYVKVDSSATNDGTSWDNACSIHKAVDNCTGADEYFIYVGAGTYKDVEIIDSIGHTHWIGSGADETKVWGVVEPNPALPAKYVFRLMASCDEGYTDTSSVEITGFEFHGYEATSGVEDSATLYAIKINEPTSGFYIHDNVFYNFLRSIFICSNTRHGRIEDNWIGKPIKYGMEIGGGFEHRISNNVIDSLLDGRIGIYSAAGQGQIVYSENIINATGGRGFHFTAASQRGVVVNNYVRAVVADSAFEDLGNNVFLANHMQSQISDPQTIEEDIYSIDTKVNDMWGVTEPNRNRLNLYVSTNGSDDSSGLTWQAAVLTLRVAEFKCTGADEYYIYVAPGTYASTSCTTETANVHWVGAGRDRVLLSGTVGKPVMMITGDGVTMSGFRLTGGNDTWVIDGAEYFEVYDCFSQQDVTNDAMWIMDDAHYGRVYNNYFRGGNIFTGFNVQGDGNLFYDNVIDSAKAAGILFGGTAAWNQVMNNYVNAIGTGQGIKHGNSDPASNFFAGNYVYAETDGNDYAEPYSDGNFYVGNQGRSWRFEQDTATSVQDDLEYMTTQGDSVLNAIHDDNKPNFKATGFATDSDGDSVIAAIADANKPNFYNWSDAQRDSILNTVEDVNKVNFMRWTAAEVGSLLNTIEDANKVNYMRWTAAEVGSLLNTIEDANKANYKATGFSVAGDPMTLQNDSLKTLMGDVDAIKAKTDNLPVDPADDSDLDAQLSVMQTDLDNPTQYKATGFATSTQGDSITEAITDVNKANFKATGFSTSSDLDSLEGAVTDINKANFKATGFATSSQGDSLTTAVTDANKVNFKATDFATSTQGDSVTGAITDANKVNFKSTGFAVSGDPMTLKGDSLATLMTDVDGIKTKTDNLPVDPADDSDMDAQLSSIQSDLDDPGQYKATGFATSAQGDSVTGAITDVNKDNFKFGMGEGDSVKAYLSAHDSTLLELAAGGASNWTNAQRDSVLKTIEDANKANYKATGFAIAGDPMALQGDSLATLMLDADSAVAAISDVNKANFKATGYAVAGDPMTLQGDSLNTLMADVDSAVQAIADANKPNFKATGFATAESVHTAITDVNKANFKYGGGADSVKAYLATHDSTLLELAAGGASNWTDAQRDSILNTILDLNKPNFRASGFSVPGDPMTLKGDSLNTLMADVDGVKAKTDNLPTDPADDSDIDNQLSSIQQDLNNPSQYKATGFAVAGDPMTWQSDSAYSLMADVDAVKAKTDNLPTDPADDSDIDAQLATIQTDLDDPSQYKATGFAVPGDPVTLQGDSLVTLMTDADAIKAKTDNLPIDPADDSDIDAQLNSIATDLNDPNQYKADVWANVDTTDVDSSDIGLWLVNNTGGAGGGSDTTSIKAMMQKNWDADTDGELSVETSTGADSSVMKKMMQNNWDPDTDGFLSAELTTSGSGSNSVIVRCKSSTDSASIPGASVALWNADQSALMGLLESDADSGKAVFAADNGVYYLRIQKYKFQWDVPIRMGVSGNKDTTIYATEFTPTPPPSVDFCTVYGYIDSVGLRGGRATITCTIHEENLRVGTKVLSYGAYSKTVYTNASGYWEMFLYPNDDITPADTRYEFKITVPTQPQPAGTRKVEVPDVASWEYTW